MHHQPDAGFFGGPFRQLGHLYSHDLQGGGNHARFDTGDHIAILGSHLDSFVQIDAGRAEDVRSGSQAGAADVQEADDFGIVAGYHVLGYAAKGVATRAAGIHHGGDPGSNAPKIGFYAVAVDSVIDVGMQVNQTGSDDFPGHGNHSGSLFCGYVGRHPGNLTVFNSYIVETVQVLGGIDDRPALDQQIVHGARNLLDQVNISPTERPLWMR